MRVPSNDPRSLMLQVHLPFPANHKREIAYITITALGLPMPRYHGDDNQIFRLQQLSSLCFSQRELPLSVAVKMSDQDDPEADTKSKRMPSWQNATKETSPTTEPTVPTEQLPSTESREALLDHARQFLAQDEVRDASTERKIEFLEKKGLDGEEIKKLLGVERNSEASSEVVLTAEVRVTTSSNDRHTDSTDF